MDATAVETEARTLAGWLVAQGLGEGDTIALLMWNDFPWLVAPRAAALIGAWLVPLNWHLTRPELDYILADCGAKVLLGHRGLLAAAGYVTGPDQPVLAKPEPPEVAAAYPKQAGLSGGPWVDWDQTLSEVRPFEGAAPTGSRGGIFYTSGTTGKPKGVKRTPLPDDAAARIRARTQFGFGLGDVGPGDVVLAPGPLYHSAPNAHALGAFAKGADLVILPRFEPASALAAMADHRVSHAHMVPTMFQRLLALPEATRQAFDPDRLKVIAHGAAPCPPAVKRAMLDWFGPVIREYYAGTETGVIAAISGAEWLAHPGSVGRAAPGCEVRVIGADGAELAPGQTGRLICQSDSTTSFRYHNRDASPEVAGWPGYVALGDIGHVDPQGFLYLTDRSSDIVIAGGVNIYPAEIEAELAALPGVQDCAAMGVPHPDLGEGVIALVVATPGAKPDEASLKAGLRGRLASYKIPQRILIVADLPREDSGKVRKRALRDLYQDILKAKP